MSFTIKLVFYPDEELSDSNITFCSNHFHDLSSIHTEFEHLKELLGKLPSIHAPIAKLQRKKPIDWAKELGTFVPLVMKRIESRKYYSVIQFEDNDYLEYYEDDLVFDTGFAKLRSKYDGWVVKPEQLPDAEELIADHNRHHIPQADTVEWDCFYEEDRVLFFPNLNDYHGKQEEGDSWGGVGMWDDVARAFVFTYEDWEKYMNFAGYV